MKFFSHVSFRLKPLWSFSAAHTLWRVIFSHSGYIVCEERNTDEKNVSFSCIESTTGKMLWSQYSFNERWWIGVEGITGDRLYLHGFKKPDMPEHLGIIAVDLQTGNELWRSMQSSFLTDDGLFVYGFKDLFERRVYHKFDRITGAFIEQLEELPAGVDENPNLEKTDFVFPHQCSGNEQFIIHGAKLLRINPDAIRSSEYAQNGSLMIVNVHSGSEKNDGTLKNSLIIIDSRTEKKVYSDVLNESTPYPVPDSFFMDGQKLFYIKERKALVCILLP
jgi:hypothetical protein